MTRKQRPGRCAAFVRVFAQQVGRQAIITLLAARDANADLLTVNGC